jgi:hypothetical protein
MATYDYYLDEVGELIQAMEAQNTPLTEPGHVQQWQPVPQNAGQVNPGGFKLNCFFTAMASLLGINSDTFVQQSSHPNEQTGPKFPHREYRNFEVILSKKHRAK